MLDGKNVFPRLPSRHAAGLALIVGGLFLLAIAALCFFRPNVEVDSAAAAVETKTDCHCGNQHVVTEQERQQLIKSGVLPADTEEPPLAVTRPEPLTEGTVIEWDLGYWTGFNPSRRFVSIPVQLTLAGVPDDKLAKLLPQSEKFLVLRDGRGNYHFLSEDEVRTAKKLKGGPAGALPLLSPTDVQTELHHGPPEKAK